MAAIKIRKFRNIEEANLFLTGGIIGGAPVTNQKFEDLVGKTITFTAPAGTKTFTQPANKPLGQLSFQDVKSQLEAAIANLKVVTVNGYIAFRHATAGTAVTLASANEPARAQLGFENNVAIAGLVLSVPGGAAPSLVSMVPQHDTIYINSVE